ncbi:DUF1198 family protein [Erwinia oleae]|uniref:DUF1198 family protein n=1 Tax=Erwinia oleae TaxID=796334 RepID=UPI000552729B|nr:DUF1198 family protein [Erwinia oleae]
MIWLMLLTLAIVFFIGFRVLHSRTRRAVKALTRKLNIDVVWVESLIAMMGKNAGEEFVDYLTDDNDAHLANAASVLLIYQTFIVDESEENLIAWQAVMRKAHLPAALSIGHVRLALSFLREIEPDAEEMHAFRQRYNARFAPEEEIPANGNVFSIHSRLH